VAPNHTRAGGGWATRASSANAQRDMRGDVVSWDDGRGYGFVKRDDGGPDIFVHHKGLLMEGRRMLDVGQRVEFDEKPGERLEAVQVRVVTMRPPTTTTSLPTRAATSLIPRAVARRAATGSSSSKRQATDAAPAAAPASKRRTTGPGASKAALKDRRSECG
jgi:CspA family cold shock protein